MTLIWGLGGLASCPVCLIATDKLSDLLIKAEICTLENSMASFIKVQKSTSVEAEAELKPKGLRRIYVSIFHFQVRDYNFYAL